MNVKVQTLLVNDEKIFELDNNLSLSEVNKKVEKLLYKNFDVTPMFYDAEFVCRYEILDKNHTDVKFIKIQNKTIDYVKSRLFDISNTVIDKYNFKVKVNNESMIQLHSSIRLPVNDKPTWFAIRIIFEIENDLIYPIFQIKLKETMEFVDNEKIYKEVKELILDKYFYNLEFSYNCEPKKNI